MDSQLQHQAAIRFLLVSWRKVIKTEILSRDFIGKQVKFKGQRSWVGTFSLMSETDFWRQHKEEEYITFWKSITQSVAWYVLAALTCWRSNTTVSYVQTPNTDHHSKTNGWHGQVDSQYMEQIFCPLDIPISIMIWIWSVPQRHMRW